ncbi:MAG: hypothetical protein LC639_07775 [Idiomarina sp.]|nr:hypothetical protein [Idiomarina sp.]
MKTLNLITLSLLTAGLTAPVFAQQTEVGQNDFYLGARLGVFAADSERVAVKNGQVFSVQDGLETITSGIEAGMMFTEAWEARIYYDYMDADLVGGGGSYGDSYGVDALYHFNNSFYAGLGVNNTEIGDVTDVAARLTLGHRSFITDNLAWRIEGGAQRGWEEDYSEMFANVGLQWFFDGRDTSPEPRTRPETRPEPQKAAPEPEPKPVDSDGDGVVDSKDKCANTPKNYSVDETGCINRVDFKGHGESQPKVRENSAADRQDNRRIEATLKVINRVPKKR